MCFDAARTDGHRSTRPTLSGSPFLLISHDATDAFRRP